MKCGLHNEIDIRVTPLTDEAAWEFINTLPDFAYDSLMQHKLEGSPWQLVLNVQRDRDARRKTTTLLTWANAQYGYIEREEYIR